LIASKAANHYVAHVVVYTVPWSQWTIVASGNRKTNPLESLQELLDTLRKGFAQALETRGGSASSANTLVGV
jgi:hypothetical protein